MRISNRKSFHWLHTCCFQSSWLLKPRLDCYSKKGTLSYKYIYLRNQSCFLQRHKKVWSNNPKRAQVLRCLFSTNDIQPTYLALSLLAYTPSASLVQFTSSLSGLAVLALVIIVHEAGHFFAARLQGIRVKNFSIGFGPSFLSYKPKNSETEFSLRMIPLGGFVSFPEETTKDESTGETKKLSDPNLLSNRPVGQRAIVISAGVVANIFFAWISLFSSISLFGMAEPSFSPGAVIMNIQNLNGPASQAGLQQNDVIVELQGEPIPASGMSAKILADNIRSSGGKVLKVTIKRGEEYRSIELKPECCNKNGEATLGGVELIPNMKIIRQRPTNVWSSIELTNSEFTRFSSQVFGGLYRLITNFRQSSNGLAGPIGVVSMGAELAKNDAASLFSFAAAISINLALINSLPIPALDGGQMIFLLWEAIRGVPLSMKVQDAVNRTALFLFLVASGFLLIGDLDRLHILPSIFK
ncbi:hypothetical protein GpartN1_g4150.t1 [Galdieria partita]|uniref:PDZ domain-containing protein n=1 Tax=Galdieria partita TaxID=83374 RepID=A0A9C7PXH4_9RHOD|nr:hypothetical protein GpartN1_g4150.t1 [Galdieria partita]